MGFDEFQDAGCKPNTLMYSAMATVCEMGLRWANALCYLEEMQTACLEPDSASFNSVLLALLAGGKNHLALCVYDEALRCGAIQHRLTNGMLDLHGLPVEVAKVAVQSTLLHATESLCAVSRG